MTSPTPSSRPRLVLGWLYYLTAVFFLVYLFVYYWTGEGGPTMLAITLVPVTFILYALDGLRKNEFYPRLTAAANYAIAAAYIAVSIAVAVYMNREYYEIGTVRAGSWTGTFAVASRITCSLRRRARSIPGTSRSASRRTGTKC